MKAPKMLDVKKPRVYYYCATCERTIAPGKRHTKMTIFLRRVIVTKRICTACAAIYQDWHEQYIDMYNGIAELLYAIAHDKKRMDLLESEQARRDDIADAKRFEQWLD